MIGGFELPTSGAVLIQGKTMGATPAYRRNVNTVFQSYALFPHLTVAQNVAFGLQMQRVGKSEQTRRVDDALHLVRLEGHGARRPRQLSGGQQQRVALARALVNEPALLLLDEPLGALDLKLRKELQLELRRIQERVGITFIYVTHDQEEALTLSDRIAVMNKGRVLQVGSPAEIYEHPTSRFVAEFIGESNLIPGEVVEMRDGMAMVRVSEGVLVSGRAAQPLTTGDRVTVAIRPEKARLHCHRPDAPHVFAVVVDRVVYVGPDTRIFATLDGQHTFVTREQNGSPSDGATHRYSPGDTAYVTVPIESASVLAN